MTRIQHLSIDDEEAQALIDAFKRGWHCGIQHLLEAERRVYNIPDDDFEALVRETYVMLITMPAPVLEAHMESNLTRKSVSSPEVKDALALLEKRAAESGQPALYRQSIAREDGTPPTATQWMHAIYTIEQHYLRKGDPAIAAAIDSFKGQTVSIEDAEAGHRKYLTTNGTGRGPILMSRWNQLQMSCSEYKERLHPVQDKQSPFWSEIPEMGFSGKPFKRLHQHREHRSSNYIMNIFEATFAHSYRGQFRLHQQIIFLVFDPIQGPLGEIVVTRMGQGEICNGRGFTVYPAGRSNNSAYDFGTREYMECQEWAMSYSGAVRNHEAYMKFLKEARKEDVPPLVSEEEIYQEEQGGSGWMDEYERAMADLCEDGDDIDGLQSGQDKIYEHGDIDGVGSGHGQIYEDDSENVDRNLEDEMEGVEQPRRLVPVVPKWTMKDILDWKES